MSAAARSTAAIVLVATALAGCGGNDQDDYCEALRTEQETLADLSSKVDEKGSDVLTPTLAAFERLRSAAPSALRDEWDTVVLAQQALRDAVEDAGVDPSAYRPGKTPPGVSAAEARRLGAVASKLDSPRVRDAAIGVEEHAREVCGVDFSGS